LAQSDIGILLAPKCVLGGDVGLERFQTFGVKLESSVTDHVDAPGDVLVAQLAGALESGVYPARPNH
jgi:hypothetical protein